MQLSATSYNLRGSMQNYRPIWCVYIIGTLLAAAQGQERCLDEEKMHLCSSDGACIDKGFLCDGIRDCADGSDETTNVCQFRGCGGNFGTGGGSGTSIQIVSQRTFRCNYGACISDAFVCDGLENCADGSDESEDTCANKICKVGHFQCGYGACIPLSYVCNGLVNCYDGTDEMDGLCNNFRPCQHTFRCAYGACIRLSQVCNGISNCRDDSDENEAECGAGHTFRSHSTPFSRTSFNTSVPIAVTDGPTLRPSATAEKGCSRTNIASEVSIQVFDCGDGSCSSLVVFPFGTLILASCTDASRLLRCMEDSLWHSEDEPKDRMEVIACEPASPNAIATISTCSYNRFEGRLTQILKCDDQITASACSTTDATAGTLITVTCAHTKSQILQCLSDGKWHVLGDTGFYVASSCEQQTLQGLPTECGKRETIGRGALAFEWPVLVGLFKDGQYICTGTFISSSMVITGAHCVVVNQASNQEVISPHTLRVQHYQNGIVVQSLVSTIHLHPSYTGGRQLRYDAAIIKLTRPVIVPGEYEPVCLDTEGQLLQYTAQVFNRTINNVEYSWDLFTHTMDVSCFNRNTQCSRHLSIGPEQFCGVNKASPLYLHHGSSGGPYLIAKEKSQGTKWYIAGIVSYSVSTDDVRNICTKPHTVYTSIDKIHDWIQRCSHADCD